MYSLSGTDVDALGTAATNMADSLFGILADLLPVMIPVIVIMFAIGFVLSLIKKR